MQPGPSSAAKLAHSIIDASAPPEATRIVLRDIIVTSGWYSGSIADDKADEWLGRFTSSMEASIVKAESTGNFISFRFNSSGTDYLQGACYVEPTDDATVSTAKRLRARTPEIAKHFLTLSANDFEKLSSRVLTIFGVADSFVSRSSADQGVDFFGKLVLGSFLLPKVLAAGGEKHLHVWLVGQSKHYPETKIGTGDIRQLVGSVELARAKVFAGPKDPLTDLTARLCDPIIYIFFTTGRFSRDSLELMDRAGVLAFDGQQLGQLLADAGIGIVAGVFDAPEFARWLHM